MTTHLFSFLRPIIVSLCTVTEQTENFLILAEYCISFRVFIIRYVIEQTEVKPI